MEANDLEPFGWQGFAAHPTACFTRPAWFAPRSPAAYEAWRCEPGRDCLLLRDRDSGELFVDACAP